MLGTNKLKLIPHLFAILAAAETFPWPHDLPDQHGMNAPALDAWRAKLAPTTKALLVVHGGKIVYEWYAEGQDQDRKQGTASLAKAIVGGSSLMLALQDGRLKADDRAAKYIPAWLDDPQKSRITIRQLA